MQYREKAGQSVGEPITGSEMLTYLGIESLGTDDTNLISDMITTARVWMESYTGLSLVSKSYEVRFYTEDAWNDYYELPFSPVTEVTSVEISGTAVDYDQKGLDHVYIRPQQAVITNTTSDEAYLDCEFIAGANNDQANMVLRRIVADMWNNRMDNLPASPAGTVSFGTMKLIETLNENTEL